ncbi:MAG: PilZ domain-containing protein [Devosia sp.]
MMSEPQTEKRANQRRPTLKGGKIVFNGGRSTIDCTVRNLSRDGAKLQVASVIGIPDSFDLMLPNTARQPCRIAWRKVKEIGVVFTASH